MEPKGFSCFKSVQKNAKTDVNQPFSVDLEISQRQENPYHYLFWTVNGDVSHDNYPFIPWGNNQDLNQGFELTFFRGSQQVAEFSGELKLVEDGSGGNPDGSALLACFPRLVNFQAATYIPDAPNSFERNLDVPAVPFVGMADRLTLRSWHATHGGAQEWNPMLAWLSSPLPLH